MTIRFLLVCDGSSGTALVPHITRLFIGAGQIDPLGSSWYGSRPLADRIRDGLQHTSECDLLLVHRDAEASRETFSAGPERRYAEIEKAVRDSGFSGPWVGVIPVRMTESWLLLDETAIRRVAGRPHGDIHLSLPLPSRVEREANPKEILFQALMAASGKSGRRLRRFERDIPALRFQLLQDLPAGGPLEQVPSWVRFRDNLLSALTVVGNQ